jgi:hypothetical protein
MLLQRTHLAYVAVIEFGATLQVEAKMATITATPSREFGLFGRLGAAASKVASAIAEARQMAARYEQLRRMPNSELAKLGCTRDEIAQLVVRGL